MGPTITTIPIRLPNGTVMRAEVTPIATSGSPERDVANVPEVGEQDITKITGTVEGLAASFAGIFPKLGFKEASVEFGVELGVETGGLTALLVKGTGSASLKVNLVWKASD